MVKLNFNLLVTSSILALTTANKLRNGNRLGNWTSEERGDESQLRNNVNATSNIRTLFDTLPVTRPSGCPKNPREDVILEWNYHALEAVVADHSGADRPGDELRCTQGPPASALQLAMVHLAMFDASNSVDKRREPYNDDFSDADSAGSVSAEAAVAQAAHDVLAHSYPSMRRKLRKHLQCTLSRISNERAKDRGREVGEKAARALIRSRRNDKSCDYGGYRYDSRNRPGRHQPDPKHPNQVVISPHFGKVKPCVVADMGDFEVKRPPSLDSDEYAEAYNEVKRMGGDGKRTPTDRTWEGTVIGWYHSYNGSPKIGTPPVAMNEVARVISKQEGNTLADNAYMFAMLNAALSDAGIAAWRSKFEYDFWRPINAIRDGSRDGNRDTEPDRSWTYLGATRSYPVRRSETNFSPPFPAYTSGHAAFCAAGMKTLMNFYGTNDISFSFMSKEWNGETLDDKGRVRPMLIQEFRKLSHFASQCAVSRIYNGVHFRFDGVEGMRQGYEVADYVYENSLRRLNRRTPRASGAPSFRTEIASMMDSRIKPKIYIPGVRQREVGDVVTSYYESEPRNS